MTRTRTSLLLLAAIAVPAAAYSAWAPTPPQQHDLCFASGSATYRIAPEAAPSDVHVKISDGAGGSDLRMQLVDRPEIADFVLVDDFGASAQRSCRSTTPIRTVTLDRGDMAPDVTVSLSADPGAADYKIYVHSMRYSQQDAAALLAAMWVADRRRAATEAGGVKTADRIKPASTMVAGDTGD